MDIVLRKKRIKLCNCPIGLFMYGNTLCLKTEYYIYDKPECYIVSSGEAFCANSEPDFNSILVTVVNIK